MCTVRLVDVFLVCCGCGNDELLWCGAVKDQMQTMKKQVQVHFLRFSR